MGIRLVKKELRDNKPLKSNPLGWAWPSEKDTEEKSAKKKIKRDEDGRAPRPSLRRESGKPKRLRAGTHEKPQKRACQEVKLTRVEGERHRGTSPGGKAKTQANQKGERSSGPCQGGRGKGANEQNTRSTSPPR